MVNLSRIYTKTGDDGTTGLGDGRRVHKDDLRVEAYGTVDEANAAVGVAVLAAERAARAGGSGAGADAGQAAALAKELAALLLSTQHDLFDVGADLCCPVEPSERLPGAAPRLRVTEGQTQRIEGAIDRHNAALEPLRSFVLPGGTELASALHVARTVVRRAERTVAALLRHEPERTSTEALRYLNRLSDLLFVLARVANGGGRADVLWKPGANR